MRTATRGLFVGLLSLWVISAATLPSAEACDSSSCSLLTRGASGLIGKGRFRLDLTFGYADQGRLLRGSQEVDTVLRPRILLEHQLVIPNFHRDISGYDRTLQMDGVYGLGAHIDLIVSLPLALRHAHDVAHGTLEQQYGTQGFGDALVGVRASLGARGLLGGFAVKLPTGANKIGGEFGGGIQDPVLQPGTGAFDFVGLVQYSRHADPLGIDWAVAATYQASTTNRLEYRFGNQTIVTATASHPLSSRLVASVQTKLFHQDRNQFLGEGVPSSGSTTLYLTPGIRLNAPRTVSFYAFVLFAPYSYVNEAQLAPRVAFVGGVSKMF